MSLKKLMCIADIERMTGKDFKTIKKKIVDLKPIKIEGKKHLYDSIELLRAIYTPTKVESNAQILRSEQAKLTRQQRIKLNLEIDFLEGKLLKVDSVIEAMQKQVLAVRSKLLAMPTKLAPEITGMKSNAEIEHVIMLEMNQALEELSEDRFADELGIDLQPVIEKINAIEALY